MTYLEIVRAAIPNASEKLAHDILLSRTLHPVRRVTPRQLYQEANRVKRATSNGVFLCSFCNNKVNKEEWECQKCQKALLSIKH